MRGRRCHPQTVCAVVDQIGPSAATKLGMRTRHHPSGDRQAWSVRSASGATVAPMVSALVPSTVREARDALHAAQGIASQADLARRWGLTRSRAWQLVRDPGFPDPAAQVNGCDLWLVA